MPSKKDYDLMNRQVLFFSSIAFVLMPFLTISCQSPPDPQPIRECFDQYKRAILNRKGEEAVHLVDSSTLKHYASMRDAALNAKSQEVRNMTTADKITVLGFRHLIGIEQLQRLSEQELFVYLIDQGQIGQQGVADGGLGQISISGNIAEGEFLSHGQRTPLKFRFVKEDGVWRIDLTALLSMADQGMRAAIRQMGVTEDEFIARMLKLMSGKPVARDILEPLVKE